jgi:hypothetical protein
MILPYLATALLILVTAYSALVTLRKKPEGAASGWLFPHGASRSARIVVCVATLALVIGLSWWNLSPRTPRQRSLRFLIPENYSGWVRVEFEIPGESALPVDAGQTVLKIPSDGLLRTSSPEQYGWAQDAYYSYSRAGVRPLPDSGPGRLIWGKINGEASGPSGIRKYEEFFVGTEQQFQEHAGEKSIGPRPTATP